MTRTVFYAVLGYLSGSVLYAKVAARLLGKKDVADMSADGNPGTTNAFLYGGFWCGVLTLLGDVLKGFFPVALYLRHAPVAWPLALVLAAPVIGHLFPVFHPSAGGKGIAVTFGCLLGLFPYGLPFFLFAACFVFLSTGIKITPHFYRTIAAYLFTLLFLFLLRCAPPVCAGFTLITATVCYRFHISDEEREKMKVKAIWMR